MNQRLQIQGGTTHDNGLMPPRQDGGNPVVGLVCEHPCRKRGTHIKLIYEMMRHAGQLCRAGFSGADSQLPVNLPAVGGNDLSRAAGGQQQAVGSLPNRRRTGDDTDSRCAGRCSHGHCALWRC